MNVEKNIQVKDCLVIQVVIFLLSNLQYFFKLNLYFISMYKGHGLSQIITCTNLQAYLGRIRDAKTIGTENLADFNMSRPIHQVNVGETMSMSMLVKHSSENHFFLC